MSMTKKDFEGLAAALRPLAIRQPYAPAPALGPDVAGALVAFCKTQNPKFDAARFLAALAGETPAPKPAPVVYVHVEGGAVSIGKPAGVVVEVVDFDTDGADAAALCDGRGCEVHRDHAHKVYDAATREVL